LTKLNRQITGKALLNLHKHSIIVVATNQISVFKIQCDMKSLVYEHCSNNLPISNVHIDEIKSLVRLHNNQSCRLKVSLINIIYLSPARFSI
jgi:hypothetical protein